MFRVGRLRKCSWLCSYLEDAVFDYVIKVNHVISLSSRRALVSPLYILRLNVLCTSSYLHRVGLSDAPEWLTRGLAEDMEHLRGCTIHRAKHTTIRKYLKFADFKITETMVFDPWAHKAAQDIVLPMLFWNA